MKNRLIFRILGALASALIIVSVFIPFVSVTGYSQSLWEANKLINALYLPIMIIVFGSIGVLSFATNIKTELAYASSGALLFYIVTQIIPVIDGGMFNTLSVGFYCLATGTVLTGIMAFICNLKIKVKIEEIKEVNNHVEEESMLNQIDKLYDDQTPVNNEELLISNELDVLPIQPLGQESGIQPLAVQNLQPIQQQQMTQSVESVQPVAQNNIVSNETVQNSNSINNPFEIANINSESSDELAAPVAINQQLQNPQQVTIQPKEQPIPMNSAIDPVNKEVTETVTENPVTAEFEQPKVLEQQNGTQQETPQVNNVEQTQPVQQNPVTAEFGGNQTNPVTAEFGDNQTNPVTAEFGGSPIATSETVIEPLGSNGNVEIEPLPSGQPKIDVMADAPTKNTSDLDIFG